MSGIWAKVLEALLSSLLQSSKKVDKGQVRRGGRIFTQSEPCDRTLQSETYENKNHTEIIRQHENNGSKDSIDKLVLESCSASS